VNPTELRNLTTEEIRAKLDETYKEMFNLRFQMARRQLKDTNRMRQVRRDIARLKTILRERELEAQWEAWKA
jgi:large subunit ribosomal protein L29